MRITPVPVGATCSTPPPSSAGVLIAIMIAILAVRFIFGLGAVTNLNDGYPWGIWVVVDVVIGRPRLRRLLGGDAGLHLQPGQYHPLIRPALLASLFGYTLAGIGASSSTSVAGGTSGTSSGLVLEPELGDVRGGGLHLRVHRRDVDRVLARLLREVGHGDAEEEAQQGAVSSFIALGTVLPMMHQSSLGTLIVVMGVPDPPALADQADPAALPADGDRHRLRRRDLRILRRRSAYRRKIELPSSGTAGQGDARHARLFIVVRFGDLAGAAHWATRSRPSWRWMFWIEMLCFWHRSR